MKNQKLFITLLQFIKEGEEQTFNEYEDAVLPLLENYGELLYRIKSDKINFTGNKNDCPDEIHLLSFESVVGGQG